LQVTLGLLRDTVSAPDEKASSPAALLKMSDARRERLLAHFKTVKPKEFERAKHRVFPWFVRIACAAAVVILFGLLMYPSTAGRSKHSHQMLGEAATETGIASREAAPVQSQPTEVPHAPPAATPAEASFSAANLSQGRTRDSDTDVYSLSAVGYINVSAPPGDAVELKKAKLDESAAAAPLLGAPPPTVDDGFVVSEGRLDGGRESDQIAGVGGVPTAGSNPVGAGMRRRSFGGGGGGVPAGGELANSAPVQLEDVAKDEKAANYNFYRVPASETNAVDKLDAPLVGRPLPATPVAGEIKTSEQAFSTFSLNVSDVSFRLAAASLDKGVMPEAGSIRSEEFINAFDYRDPEPAAGVKVSFAWERSEYPFGHHRDLLRFSLKTAAQGRQGGRPLNIVLLLDKSGSMERADRVEITRQALASLAGQLQSQDTLSVVVFARTARLWADGVAGDQAAATLKKLGDVTPEGGTNLEEAMRLAYETALRHYRAEGDNRVVLLTDGAANLGEADPDALKKKVEANRKQGIAFDCFGIGWEGYNDEMLATLSRGGGGRYGFINTPEEAATDFAGQLAGALRVAAMDVKAQVEFDPNRVISFRQIGYAKDQLTKEQFRANSVKAAQLGSAESGNALYVVEVNPTGDAPLCTVRVRYRLPGANGYREQEWTVPYTGAAVALDKSSPAMRLAATACAFSEWLAQSPYAGDVTLDELLANLNGVPEAFGADARPKRLETMIREAKSIPGK